MNVTRLLPLRFLSRPRSGHLPWVAWIAAWVLTAIGAGLYLVTYSTPLGPRWGPRGVIAFFGVLIAPLGAVVTSRRPRNAIGWIYCTIGLLSAVQFMAEEYAIFAVLGRPGWLPAGQWAAWLTNWIWVPVTALYLVFVPLLLPEGQLPSPRWRPVAWYGAATTAALALCFAVRPGRLQNFYEIVNPLGVRQAPDFWLLLGNITFVLLDLAGLAAAISLIWRLRHAAALERQQLKWLAFAFTLGGAGFIAAAAIPALAAPLILGALVGMQAATSLSILRYRLYDLDVVLNRTVVYGLLSVALAGIYLGFVVVLQSLAVALTGQQSSGLVTVISTLAIVALFNPLRHRIQRTIDRRLFRHKYDADKALARFGRAVRDQASGDLEAISADLMQVVDDTLEPASISLWVRPASQRTQP